jgi:hypothetical protein
MVVRADLALRGTVIGRDEVVATAAGSAIYQNGQYAARSLVAMKWPLPKASHYTR